MSKKSKAALWNEQREAEKVARQQQILGLDYSGAENFDELYAGLSVDEIKLLTAQNATFKTSADRLDAIPPMTQTLAPSPAEAQADSERIATEQAAEESAQQVTSEKLYEGVEKLGENRYRLTVDPEDGSNPEIFLGTSQAECWKKLRDSKKHATKELRRRAKTVQMTDEVRALQPEIVNYPALVQPLKLTPDEIFSLTEALKDPTQVLGATRKLRLASITQDEADRQNEAILHNRYTEAFNRASAWIGSHPEFYPCQENVTALQQVMQKADWAITDFNLNLGFKVLQDQGVLVERPTNDTAEPDPFAAIPPTASVAPTPTVQPAPTHARPTAAARVFRPAAQATSFTSTGRMEIVPARSVVKLTPEEYNRTPAAEAKRRYDREPLYRAQVDELIASGKI